MRRVKIAQIGTGHAHAWVTASSIVRLSEQYEIIGLAEPTEKYRANLEKEPYRSMPLRTVEDLLADDELEAVAIETEEESSTYYALLFAERGVAVHLDKPGSQDIEAFHKLVDILRGKNLPFHLGYMYRYNPMIERTIEMVKNGDLGKVYAVEAHMSVHHPAEEREKLSIFKGGMTYFLGCHLVDLMLQIMGKPDEIIPLNSSIGDEGVTAEDYGFVVFKYNGNVSFIKACSDEYNGFHRRQLVVCGTKGTVVLQPIEMYVEGGNMTTLAEMTYNKQNENPWMDTAEHLRAEPYNRYDKMMTTFAEQVRGEAENPYTYDYELEVFDTLMKCCDYKEN